MSSASKGAAAIALVVAIVGGYLWGRSDERAGRVAPLTETASAKKAELDVYYPATESLGKNEMRVVALGTGMPSVRPKQAAACWLVELGNGEKFLFDIGSGCHERLAAQKIPYDLIDKVFVGHLHVDHMGDLPSFWLGGTVMNSSISAAGSWT
ncbi:MAG: MBL fold metallo-hydrolase [Deltaproteobacteria bacterium]|nr:MBL fold metallo-hydrolase [Deltaproteobacteria bacterium]